MPNYKPAEMLKKAIAQEKVARVGIVMAGGVRSFFYDYVRNSIFDRAITRVCPPEDCDADVFMRYSIGDNVPDGQNSGGKAVEGLEAALDLSFARAYANVRVFAERVEIGSVQERAEMRRLFESHPRGERFFVLHHLDPRRFSMWFGRYKAFTKLADREKESGKKYDLVLFIRFDMFWGSDLPKYDFFLLSNKMWVHDSYFSYVPDTFMVAPRDQAEAWFAIDPLVKEFVGNHGIVGCIGGPNLNVTRARQIVDTWKKEKRELYYDMECPQHVSMLGWSEVILLHKLQDAGISEPLNTLRFLAILLLLVRVPKKAGGPEKVECNYMRFRMNYASRMEEVLPGELPVPGFRGTGGTFFNGQWSGCRVQRWLKEHIGITNDYWLPYTIRPIDRYLCLSAREDRIMLEYCVHGFRKDRESGKAHHGMYDSAQLFHLDAPLSEGSPAGRSVMVVPDGTAAKWLRCVVAGQGRLETRAWFATEEWREAAQKWACDQQFTFFPHPTRKDLYRVCNQKGGRQCWVNMDTKSKVHFSDKVEEAAWFVVKRMDPIRYNDFL